MKESTYRIRVQKLRRVTIPKAIYEALELTVGSTVEITVKKVVRLAATHPDTDITTKGEEKQ